MKYELASSLSDVISRFSGTRTWAVQLSVANEIKSKEKLNFVEIAH